jgi:hypothetical protein
VRRMVRKTIRNRFMYIPFDMSLRGRSLPEAISQ